MMATTPSAGEKALKVRHLLQNYYVVDERDEATNAADYSIDNSALATPPGSSYAESEHGSVPDPLDSQEQLRRIIRNSRLRGIIERHKALATEVAVLDSDMQTLVYENYCKFIYATDVIRALDNAMTKVDDRLNGLKDLVEGVVGRSEVVNGTLEQRQAVIVELTQAKSLLQKLQAVLQVPLKMRVALENGAYEVAAELYNESKPVLQRHGHRKAFKQTAIEVEACRSDATQRLRSKLRTEPEAAAESIAIIAQLGEETDNLQEEFFECQRRKLQAVIQPALLDKLQPNNDVTAIVASVNSRFFGHLIQIAHQFTQTFDKDARSKLLSECKDWFLRYMAAMRSLLEKSAVASVANAVGMEVVGTRPLVKAREAPTDFSEDWGGQRLIEALNRIRSDVVSLEPVLPELGPRDKASELIGNTVRYHVAVAFAALEARLVLQLREIHERIEGTMSDPDEARQRAREEISTLQNRSYRGIERCITGIQEWNAQSWTLEGWHEVFDVLVRAQVENYLRMVLQRCLVLAGLESHVDVSASADVLTSFLDSRNLGSVGHSAPLYSLVLSGFCSSVQQTLGDRANALLRTLAEESIVSKPISRNDAPVKLLAQYSTLHSEQLSSMAVASVESVKWDQLQEPRAPRDICYVIIDCGAGIDADLAMVEQAFGPTAGNISQQSHHRRHTPSTSSASLESMLGPGTASLLSGISFAWEARLDVIFGPVIAAVQAHSGALRKCTLTRGGFQQIQLDCHFLRSAVQRWIQGYESHPVLGALEELLLIAAERCGEAVLLEPSRLDRMIVSGRPHLNS